MTSENQDLSAIKSGKKQVRPETPKPSDRLTKKQMEHELTKLKLEKEHLLLTLRLKNETKKRQEKQNEIDQLKE